MLIALVGYARQGSGLVGLKNFKDVVDEQELPNPSFPARIINPIVEMKANLIVDFNKKRDCRPAFKTC